jgi:hypothetical protein
LAILGAEDEMNEISGKRLRHRKILAPLQGAAQWIGSETQGVALG